MLFNNASLELTVQENEGNVVSVYFNLIVYKYTINQTKNLQILLFLYQLFAICCIFTGAYNLPSNKHSVIFAKG